MNSRPLWRSPYGSLIVRRPLLALFISIVSCQQIALGGEFSPYRAAVSTHGLSNYLSDRDGTSGASQIKYQKVTPIAMRGRAHALGRFDLQLGIKRNIVEDGPQTRTNSAQSQQLTAELFQGTISLGGGLKRRGNSRVLPAAVAVIGEYMFVDFLGRKKSSSMQPRAYSLRIKLASEANLEARIKSVGATAALPMHCDSSVENVEGDRFSPSDADMNVEKDGAVSGRATSTAIRVITLSTDADPEWYARYGAESLAQIARIVNAAEVLYLRQVNVGFTIHAQHVYQEKSPYTATDAGTLLYQFTSNAENSANLAVSPEFYESDVDAKHLFTGKQLSGGAAGIAYLSSICLYPTLSFGLSQAHYESATIAVFAHEISHNLGAYHDVGSPTTLMYPSLGAVPVSDISAKTKGEIETYLNRNARCLTLEERQSPAPPTTGGPQVGIGEGQGVMPPPKTLRAKARLVPGRVHKVVVRARLLDSTDSGVAAAVIELYRNGKQVAVETTDEEGKVQFVVPVTQLRRKPLAFTLMTQDGSAPPRVLRVALEP